MNINAEVYILDNVYEGHFSMGKINLIDFINIKKEVFWAFMNTTDSKLLKYFINI